MRLDSARSFKALVSDEIVAASGSSVAARLFYASTERPMPATLALGVSKRGEEHLVAVRTTDPALAEVIRQRVNGEADVKIIEVFARPPTIDPLVAAPLASASATPHSPKWLQQRQPFLEGGLQVNVVGKNFVGTLGAIVKDDRGVKYALSNSHVFDGVGGTPSGVPVSHPFGSNPDDVIGLTDRFVPLSALTPNLVDCRLTRLAGTKAVLGFNGAFRGNLRGVRPVMAEDLNTDVLKIGRTTGVQLGKITAVEIDGLRVGYDQGVLSFSDQIEMSGGPTSDFSAGGDSGSIILDVNGYVIALLFAGGRDAAGVDYTYGNRAVTVFEALGVQLALS